MNKKEFQRASCHPIIHSGQVIDGKSPSTAAGAAIEAQYAITGRPTPPRWQRIGRVAVEVVPVTLDLTAIGLAATGHTELAAAVRSASLGLRILYASLEGRIAQ
jgi:hypothetical protein